MSRVGFGTGVLIVCLEAEERKKKGIETTECAEFIRNVCLYYWAGSEEELRRIFEV